MDWRVWTPFGGNGGYRDASGRYDGNSLDAMVKIAGLVRVGGVERDRSEEVCYTFREVSGSMSQLPTAH